jgi:hypothetical protein
MSFRKNFQSARTYNQGRKNSGTNTSTLRDQFSSVSPSKYSDANTELNRINATVPIPASIRKIMRAEFSPQCRTVSVRKSKAKRLGKARTTPHTGSGPCKAIFMILWDNRATAAQLKNPSIHGLSSDTKYELTVEKTSCGRLLSFK